MKIINTFLVQLIMGEDKKLVKNKPYKYLITITDGNKLRETGVFYKKELLEFLNDKLK